MYQNETKASGAFASFWYHAGHSEVVCLECGRENVEAPKLISPKRAHRILEKHADWIETVSARYGVPSAAMKAVFFQEMTLMDVMDPIADFVAFTGVFPKKDSSTGIAQIFGYVGLNAANFAVDRGLATYESLGISAKRRLDPSNRADVRYMWRLLHHDAHANIEIATLNLLAAADEMVGRLDFETFSPEELKLVFTRYNADVKYITPYGERAYEYYLAFLKG